MTSPNGLRLDRNIVAFEFKPSIGIMASRYNTLGHNLGSFNVPLTLSVTQVLIPSIRLNFLVGGRPGWVPLSEVTLLMRAEAGFPNPTPLVRTGALQRTMADFGIWTITDTFATIKDLPQTVWYGKVHQAGYGGFQTARTKLEANKALQATGTSSDKKVYIPARPFAMIQESDARRIVEIFENWVELMIGGSTVVRVPRL